MTNEKQCGAWSSAQRQCELSAGHAGQHQHPLPGSPGYRWGGKPGAANEDAKPEVPAAEALRTVQVAVEEAALASGALRLNDPPAQTAMEARVRAEAVPRRVELCGAVEPRSGTVCLQTRGHALLHSGGVDGEQWVWGSDGCSVAQRVDEAEMAMKLEELAWPEPPEDGPSLRGAGKGPDEVPPAGLTVGEAWKALQMERRDNADLAERLEYLRGEVDTARRELDRAVADGVEQRGKVRELEAKLAERQSTEHGRPLSFPGAGRQSGKTAQVGELSRPPETRCGSVCETHGVSCVLWPGHDGKCAHVVDTHGVDPRGSNLDTCHVGPWAVPVPWEEAKARLRKLADDAAAGATVPEPVRPAAPKLERVERGVDLWPVIIALRSTPLAFDAEAHGQASEVGLLCAIVHDYAEARRELRRRGMHRYVGEKLSAMVTETFHRWRLDRLALADAMDEVKAAALAVLERKAVRTARLALLR